MIVNDCSRVLLSSSERQGSNSLVLYISTGNWDKPTKLLFITLLRRKQGWYSFQTGEEGMGKMHGAHNISACRWNLLLPWVSARLSPTLLKLHTKPPSFRGKTEQQKESTGKAKLVKLLQAVTLDLLSPHTVTEMGQSCHH